MTHNLHKSSFTPHTPYRSGYSVDKIPMDTNLPPHVLKTSQEFLQTIVASLSWLGVSTRLDIVIITNLLAYYMQSATPSHVVTAKYVLRYLKGTSHMGIRFFSCKYSKTSAFDQFLVAPSIVLPLTDANWGPKDTSVPDPKKRHEDLNLFKYRFLSGFIIWLGGPLHWISKRQSVTLRSSA